MTYWLRREKQRSDFSYHRKSIITLRPQLCTAQQLSDFKLINYTIWVKPPLLTFTLRQRNEVICHCVYGRETKSPCKIGVPFKEWEGVHKRTWTDPQKVKSVDQVGHMIGYCSILRNEINILRCYIMINLFFSVSYFFITGILTKYNSQ